jgi:hypothetical protein
MSFDEMYATSITVRMDAINFALQHEVGHAVETFVKLQAREKKFDFETGFQRIFREALATPGVRSYARSSDKESWAEAFANFYCSPESKEFIDGGTKHKGMLASSLFLSQVLMLPQWLMGGSDEPKEPVNPLDDVFVELKAAGLSGDEVIINISSLPQVVKFEFCKPEVDDTCKETSENYQKIENAQERNSRKFFLSQTPVQIKSDLNLLLVGRDFSGKIIALRQIKFSQK